MGYEFPAVQGELLNPFRCVGDEDDGWVRGVVDCEPAQGNASRANRPRRQGLERSLQDGRRYSQEALACNWGR